MSDIMLSGKLARFKPVMLIRILESVRADALLAMEGPQAGQILLQEGRIVGAALPAARGLEALREMTRWTEGAFSVRELSNLQSATLPRCADLLVFPDNATIFRNMAAPPAPPPISSIPASLLADPEPARQQPEPSRYQPEPSRGGPELFRHDPPEPSSMGTPLVSPAAPPPRQPEREAPPPQRAPETRDPTMVGEPKLGFLAKVPSLTDKGKTTRKQIRSNIERGILPENDRSRVMDRIDGKRSLYRIGEEAQVLGDRLRRCIQGLQDESLLTFDEIESALTGHFKLGEYMVAKGYVTQAQLDATLQRQQDLARKGRYMWLGEIFVELGYVRPSQVQEALAYMRRRQQNRPGPPVLKRP